jgi:hypothetical protein
VVSIGTTMQRTLVREPFHRPGWGLRGEVRRLAHALVQGCDSVRLMSKKNGVDHTERFNNPWRDTPG